MVHINQVGLHGPVDMNQLLHVLLLLAGKKKPGKVVRIILIKRVMQLGGNQLQRTQGNIIKDAVSAGFFVPAFPPGFRSGFTMSLNAQDTCFRLGLYFTTEYDAWIPRTKCRTTGNSYYHYQYKMYNNLIVCIIGT